MPSQDDDSEEVSTSFVRDVMTVMTRRLEQLLVKQHEREAKLFLFLLHNWQIMPFGHITPVRMVVCRLMV